MNKTMRTFRFRRYNGFDGDFRDEAVFSLLSLCLPSTAASWEVRVSGHDLANGGRRCGLWCSNPDDRGCYCGDGGSSVGCKV